MREFILVSLILLCSARALGQAVPPGWKLIQDAKQTCQIAVPQEWVPFGENNGAAMLHDSTTAIAVVTAQPGQEYKPLTPGLVKAIGVSKEKLFENSAKRIFYQDRAARNPEESNAFSATVPGKSGSSCSVHVVVLPSVPEDVAKKIALSLSPVPET
jgi:hypothetical protein